MIEKIRKSCNDASLFPFAACLIEPSDRDKCVCVYKIRQNIASARARSCVIQYTISKLMRLYFVIIQTFFDALYVYIAFVGKDERVTSLSDSHGRFACHFFDGSFEFECMT